jgi:hypothetical protein
MGAIYTHSLSLQPYRGGNSISHSPENFIFIIMRLESRDGFYFSFIKEEREEREEKISGGRVTRWMLVHVTVTGATHHGMAGRVTSSCKLQKH